MYLNAMNSKAQPRVFVYGTLKPGGYYWPRFCEGKVHSVVAAKVRGELYDLHVGYPGLRLAGEDWVQGYLLTFESAADFARVDELEGYDPGRPDSENEYRRTQVDCYGPAGQALGQVWAYEISDAVLKRCQGSRLVDGNWPI